MAVTIKQIAELSGVSRGTVDRVLNGRGKVRPEVEQRVRDTAERLGYRPNKIGKALAYQKKPLLFGVVANGDANSFYDEVLRGARAAGEEFADFGVNIEVMLSKGYDVGEQLAYLRRMDEMGAAGIAIAPIDSSFIALRLNELIEKNIQVVTFNSDIRDCRRLSFVGCDYLKSGRTAGGLMGRLVQREAKVGIITGSLQMLGHNQRVHGFYDVLGKEYPNLRILDSIESKDSNELSYRIVERFLEENPDIGGLYFAAGGAEGGVQAICDKGMEKQIVVITCDDTPEIRRLVRQGAIDATICQQPYEQGYRPIKILFDRIVGKIYPPSHYYTESVIKIRENL